jgi:sortase A
VCRLPAPESGRDALLLCLALVGAIQLASAGLINAKAWLAPLLVERAWRETLTAGGAHTRPWPWADTWPVARLLAPTQGADLLVLAGDSGQALAFGPGHVTQSAPLGGGGLAVVGGHRDTHFAFLERLEPGELLRLQLPGGAWRHYRVVGSRVADARSEALSTGEEVEQLMLVTCYPFDAIRPGGPLRYVVEAEPLEDFAEGQGETLLL